MIPIISFVGRHNSGKTTVLTQVIDYLSSAGFQVAVIKHVHHTLNIEPFKDSEKLFQAGADFVLASSPGLTIAYHRQEQESGFTDILNQVPENMDLIIVEGYKNESLIKIEVVRREIDPDPMFLPQTKAYISDFDLHADIPVFQFSQTQEIAAFILQIMELDLSIQK